MYEMLDCTGTWLNRAMLALLVLAFAYNAYERHEDIADEAREVGCLERNIYHEARDEPYAGKEAVAFVTAARAASGLFARTICGVTYQSRQFSWTLDPRRLDADVASRMPAEIRSIARTYAALVRDPAALAAAGVELGLPMDTYFYKRFDWDESSPTERRMSDQNKWFWRMCLEPVRRANGTPLRIGSHVFYRDRPGPCPKFPGSVPLPERNPRRLPKQK